VLLIPKRHGQTDRDRQTDRRLTVALPRSALASRGNHLFFTVSIIFLLPLLHTVQCARMYFW